MIGGGAARVIGGGAVQVIGGGTAPGLRPHWTGGGERRDG
ncbi:hypothetical protein TOK_1610 [Pseudonocardia sp. N23]|nr:hypothetical protein TOK_1610 [Pseudonocardia sp. N23]